MRHKKLALAVLAAAIPTSYAVARVVGDFDVVSPTFELAGRPIGGAKPASATAAQLAGSRIAALPDGALVIDADSGALIRTDASGKHVAHVAVGRDAGLLAYDPATKLAYVADRKGDRIAVVSVGGALEIKASWKTPAEPFGVALSPDGKRLLVTTIADRTLAAFDVATGREAWRTPLAREPRGVAIAPDGTRALVAYLATGTVDQIDLADAHHDAEHIALSTGASRRSRLARDSDPFVRGAFTVAFMGEHQAVVPFQRETPVQAVGAGESTGSYGGGGFEPPVTHQVAFIGLDRGRTTQVTAQIAQNQPRAIAWDQAHDALYIAGLGTDSVLQIKHASAVEIAAGMTANLVQGKDRCGPDGLAIAPDGGVYVWCSFTRTVDRIAFGDGDPKVTASAPLVASAMTDKQHDGMVLFHAAIPQVSSRGAMACATCHPDGRADGLSWRIEKHELQTPILAGRVTGTGPFKWDGTDPDLKASMTSTMRRLGGMGLDAKQTDALGAYLEFMPKVRAPTRDATAVARGKKLFDSAELGCRSCHDGAHYTDQERHKLTGTLEQVDTPSLHALAASAPYFHDGSAATLESLLRDRGAVHGMASTEKLTDQQVADLTAFLETL